MVLVSLGHHGLQFYAAAYHRRMRPSLSVHDRQRREIAALRLAIKLLLAAIWSQAFTHELRPLGDAWEAQLWLQRSLTPLSPASPAIRELVRLLRPDGSPRSWGDPKWLRRELRRLERQTKAKKTLGRGQGA